MRTLCFLGLTVVLMASGCASQDGESFVKPGYDFSAVTEVAVLAPTGDVYNTAVKNQIANMFQIELMRKGYDCVERAEIQSVIKEQEFQASGITTTEGAAQAGRVLNVPVVMVVSVPEFEQKISVTAKLIRVEDGVILWIGDGSGSTGKTASTIFGAAVGAGLGAVLGGGDSDDRLAGGVIGGVLGGVAGNAMAPSVEKQFKKIVREKVCKDLPPRYATIPATK
ncbi:MAG: glycine zipper 2TM domain-containing protein [Phycisphaeraceae bacterium]|nr:glycine zipper 2TM domain-containing protein [Phycisphaeraceae bacterium]